ncbi:GMC oxidoreductase [Streptomyces sp. Li-HN-5-11]|nr:GMC oxidoreductase [Streptomyces sp. Li-HN-5-11]WNM32566.1 GMC oxidoreductase [Streptomyces sp. Li-HN-5-11]WOP38685.1 GMC oxidoreductase [Streptomyces sp. Li-HN-5-13]
MRGVDGLRVVDCSTLPTMVSGNLNAPAGRWPGMQTT